MLACQMSQAAPKRRKLIFALMCRQSKDQEHYGQKNTPMPLSCLSVAPGQQTEQVQWPPHDVFPHYRRFLFPLKLNISIFLSKAL